MILVVWVEFFSAIYYQQPYNLRWRKTWCFASYTKRQSDIKPIHGQKWTLVLMPHWRESQLPGLCSLAIFLLLPHFILNSPTTTHPLKFKIAEYKQWNISQIVTILISNLRQLWFSLMVYCSFSQLSFISAKHLRLLWEMKRLSKCHYFIHNLY